MTDEQRGLFELSVIERLDQAKRLKGYKFLGIRSIIKNRGAVEIAKSFIGPNNTANFNGGMRMLVKVGLSDLTIEQAVIDFKDTKLFSKKEVASAKKRLDAVKAFFEKK